MGWNAVPKMFRQPHSKSHIFVPETSPVAPFLPSPPPSPCLSAARLQGPRVQSAKAVHPKPPMKILDHPPCSHHRAWQPEMPLVSAPLPQFISAAHVRKAGTATEESWQNATNLEAVISNPCSGPSLVLNPQHPILNTGPHPDLAWCRAGCMHRSHDTAYHLRHLCVEDFCEALDIC